MAASTATAAVAARHRLSTAPNQNPHRPTLFFPLFLKAHRRHLPVRLSSPSPSRPLLPRAAAEGADAGEAFPEFDFDKPREECGVVGIVGHPGAAQLCYLGLHALQHRGEEGAGIVSADESGELHPAKGLGLVSEVFDPSSSHNLSTLPGSAAIGHVRYSTAGATATISNVQPLLASYRFGPVAVAHNGNLVNYHALRSDLEEKGSIFNTSSDTEVILHLIATSKSRPFVSRVAEACRIISGAYSLLFLTSDKLLAVRDPHGFRPLVLGHLPVPNSPPAIVFASETCALDLIGAVYDREVLPGEILAVDLKTLSITPHCLTPPKPRKACVFELIYFALPQSVVFDHPVSATRHKFGAALAAESPAPGADVVIPVPDSGFYAALGYAEKSGLQFQQGLIRNHYVGRTFIQPGQEIRDLAVKLKLSPVRHILEGKSVVVIDDSIVRGTTSSKIVRLLRESGAREVHMRIASPPIIGSCYYGIDTPRSEELISNRMDVEGVRKEIGADSLAFLSLDSLRRLLEDEAPMFCDACFSRDYPVPPVEVEGAVVADADTQ